MFLFNRCDRFSLIPFLRIFPRFSLLLFLYGGETAVVTSSASDCVPFFLPFPIVSICPVLPPSCFSSLFWLETNQCIHVCQKDGHKWSISVTGIFLPAVSSVDSNILLWFTALQICVQYCICSILVSFLVSSKVNSFQFIEQCAS